MSEESSDHFTIDVPFGVYPQVTDGKARVGTVRGSGLGKDPCVIDRKQTKEVEVVFHKRIGQTTLLL